MKKLLSVFFSLALVLVCVLAFPTGAGVACPCVFV